MRWHSALATLIALTPAAHAQGNENLFGASFDSVESAYEWRLYTASNDGSSGCLKVSIRHNSIGYVENTCGQAIAFTVCALQESPPLPEEMNLCPKTEGWVNDKTLATIAAGESQQTGLSPRSMGQPALKPDDEVVFHTAILTTFDLDTTYRDVPAIKLDGGTLVVVPEGESEALPSDNFEPSPSDAIGNDMPVIRMANAEPLGRYEELQDGWAFQIWKRLDFVRRANPSSPRVCIIGKRFGSDTVLNLGWKDDGFDETDYFLTLWTRSDFLSSLDASEDDVVEFMTGSDAPITLDASWEVDVISAPVERQTFERIMRSNNLKLSVGGNSFSLDYGDLRDSALHMLRCRRNMLWPG